MNTEWINALIGGSLIGIAVSIMLALNGRVAGISGIVNGLIHPQKGDMQWRAFFVGGLFFGGLLISRLSEGLIAPDESTPLWRVMTAGLLVGFGTIMGNGCTSGHGICGISRLSPRSIFATLSFIAAGMLSVWFVQKYMDIAI